MDSSKSSASRRVLRTTSDADRQHIISAYENGTSAAEASQLLNVKKITIHGIIKRYKETWQIEAKKRGGNHAKLLSKCIRGWIDEDCIVTLKALGEKLFREHGVRASRSTIAKEIKYFNYSFKMIQRVPERRNTGTRIEERTAYATSFYDIAREIPVDGLVYYDEVGFNINIRT
uniref:Paired domain-containing protein n=1 Tax=Anopheles culicifacies TaxID=139723 RepID=A0A182MLK3_9DIPT